jgi:hypothetical protein
LSIGAGSEFSRAAGNATLEIQPDLFTRRNVSFYFNGDVAERSTYAVTAGIRIYFGPDKPLIRRHREDDPGWAPVFFDPVFTGSIAPAPGGSNGYDSSDIIVSAGPGRGPQVYFFP